MTEVPFLWSNSLLAPGAWLARATGSSMLVEIATLLPGLAISPNDGGASSVISPNESSPVTGLNICGGCVARGIVPGSATMFSPFGDPLGAPVPS